MDVDAFLDEVRADSQYADQIVHVHVEPPRDAEFADFPPQLSSELRAALNTIGIERLYGHQAEALRHAQSGGDVVIATSTASGKTLCYALRLLELLQRDAETRALLVFPTKALCQDQFQSFNRLLSAVGLTGYLVGVFDGDTPADLRRRLRDKGSVIFTNPDMIHAAMMTQHGRWSEFLSCLSLVVLDELHVYSGILGSNMALLLRRLFRVCRHYGAAPQIMALSATIANPEELFLKLTARPCVVVDRDGSPRGKRTTVLWNPPRIRQTNWRSRRSANVEAHELMARLIANGVPTITFSKAKMTAEMIYRYVCDKLREIAPQQASKVTPYRGGYRPSDRRDIEKRLFNGELLGVSTTCALELGIDVGNLEACIMVGYPGTLASFFQQGGRAGRKDRDAVVFLIGLDTSINQYIVSQPDYLFNRSIEHAVVDPDNPFVGLNQLRCAAFEMPLEAEEIAEFGKDSDAVLRVLEENHKVARIEGRWYYATSEIPQHEFSLRNSSDANVLIEDVDTGEVLGEVDRFDAPPILHPHAIYMHLGDTFIVETLDLDKNIASVKRIEVDYYTQPLGGTDIHHIDHQLREKPFGNGTLYWGEVTAYFNTNAFEKVHFYSLDAISVHGLDLPTMQLETMAFWIVPCEDTMERVRKAGLDAHSGLRGIGYATRMLLPLFMTCDTLDFSHTVGSVNSPWNAVFVYERYPHGLGFTEKAYHRMHEILPRALDSIENCPCEDGCPCCVGKPLRQYSTWNVERGEASIPSKAAALMILHELLSESDDLEQPEAGVLTESSEQDRERLRQALRRRLERMGEPQRFHAITPRAEVRTEYPDIEPESENTEADATKRGRRRRDLDRELHKRLAKKLGPGGLDAMQSKAGLRPRGMKTGHSNLRPTDFPGKPEQSQSVQAPIALGDSLASRARRKAKSKRK
ncbi:MAG: DEAD/DEAH box helicase [Verrucomicrobia bacterium]|jgi:DEAD/DEAH box helicase domain-containing protein|nr:DEAD/DEAH box helicase [Verrucomicrobiota bacterium]